MILMYHKVAPSCKTIWWVDIYNFYRQMYELQDRKIVYLQDYNPNDESQVVITFDGLYKNVIEYAVPILKKFNYPFETFITSDYLGKDNKFDKVEPYAKFADIEDLKFVINNGGRVQWHTKSHVNLCEVDDNELNKEMKVPNELTNLSPYSFQWFAYPYGEFNEKVIEKAKVFFKGAVSCNQGSDNNKYTFNRLTVKNKTSFRKNKISVIIPSYNYGRFLEEAVESVLEQTILPDEILIVDDASTDNTELIGKYYKTKYPELVEFYKNPFNLGIVKNFNQAVNKVSGDFICFLGADNKFKKDYIEKTSQILLKNKEVGIAYTDFQLFGERAKTVYESFLPERRGIILEEKYYNINFPDFDKEELKKGNYIHGSSMYKKSAYKEVGGYIDKGNTPEDYNLFLRMILKGWEAKRVPEPLLEYRQHSEEQANIKVTMKAELEWYKKQNKKLLQIVEHRDKDIEELRVEIGHRDKNIEELIRVIEHRDKDIEELRGVIEHRDKDIEELREVIEHRDKDVEELREIIEHRDKDIEELRGVIEHRDKDIEELREVIEHRDKDIEELRGVIEHRDKEIEKLREAIGYRDKDIEELRGIIDSQDNKNKILQKKYDEQKNVLENLKRESMLQKDFINRVTRTLHYKILKYIKRDKF